jgi:hypothetical protein
MNIGTRSQQDCRCPPFVLEGNAVRGHGHERRSAARQKDKELFVGLCTLGNGQRAAASLFTALPGFRMLRGDTLEGSGRFEPGRPNDEAAPHARTELAADTRRHDRRSLSRGDKPDGAITRLPLMQGGGYERTGIGRANGSMHDSEQIQSKGSERVGQWVCLGSVHPERPVTTSNFFRRLLTTSSALSLEQRFSSWPMIRVNAASTSVMAVSEK